MSQTITDTVPSTELSEVDMATLAKTRSSGISFVPPETHDMVRSLFDPTIKKSFLELCITSALLFNFVVAYFSVQWFGRSFTRKLYILQYVFWRLCYNGGIGIVLHYQSHYETLTKWAKKSQIFNKKNSSLLGRFLQFEVGAKLPSKNKIYEYPPELTTWLLFRQFVDLILMQDFDTYIIFVFLSLPDTNLSVLFNWKSVLGIVLILFNVWVKLDAHRVVKDFAWYWGDFFFLQTNSELVFDGVFNISPHPMYSIGYLGYYGLSLITGDYQVLLVSILGHFLQFLFLKYVETPHIDRTYGQANDNVINGNTPATIDDLIAKENFDYSRPLISTGMWLTNFNKLRISDYFTVTTVLTIVAWYITYSPTRLTLFFLTFSIKFLEWVIVGTILYKQSEDKWFTKLFMKNGYTQLYSFQQWQFIYNFSLVLSYTLLTIQTINNVRMIPFKEETYTQLIFGLLLCALQVWCDTEIRDAISDFGWFYGDFFLSNYITSRKLTSEGIYRYLNNPEAILGVAGIWGTVLMTNFAKDNIVLASLWTFSNFMLVKFVETPHMEKLYGSEQRISGVGKTLLSLKPLKRVSEIVDNIEHIIMRSILNNNENHPVVTTATTSTHMPKDHDDYSKRTNNAKDWENVIENAIKNVTSRLTPNCEFELNLANEEEACSVVPDPVEIDWKLPTELYNDNDWIGLYSVISTRNNREFTRVPSFGHWVHTKDHVVEHTDDFVRGKIVFDASLLYYEVGTYEFRYHSKDTHKVLMISTPFQVRLPQLDTSGEAVLRESLLTFLQAAQVIKDEKFFDYENGNKYFNIKSLQRVIKNSIGVELSNEYIRKVNGDVDIMANRIWDIKKILDELE